MGIFCDDLDGFCIPLRISVAQDIYRIGVAPGLRKKGGEFLYCLFSEACHLSAMFNNSVSGKHGGSAGICYDGQPRAGEAAPAAREHLCKVEKLGDRVDANDA